MKKPWENDTQLLKGIALYAQGNPDEWGAGDSVAEEELPAPPSNVVAKPGNGRNFITWDPVPEALYYNIYFLTTKGVQIKFSELTRPIAGPDDFNPIKGVKKEKETLSRAQPARSCMRTSPTVRVITMS